MRLWNELQYKLAIVRTLLPERPWTGNLLPWLAGRAGAARAAARRAADRATARWPSTRAARRWLDTHARVVSVGALALAVTAAAAAAIQLRGPGASVPAREIYYWDLDTNQPFTHSDRHIPPIDAPSGGLGARAHLFTCGQCAPDQWFGYLERYTERAKRAQFEGIDGMDPLDPRVAEFVADNHLIRALDGEQWVAMSSDEGDLIRRAARDHCDSRDELRPCRPGDR